MIFPLKRKIVLAVVLAVIALAFVLVVVLVVKKNDGVEFKNDQQKAQSAAIVTNGYECSAIAGEILKEGGSVADAAITALLCEGVTCPQSTGLGGGFVMTIFTKQTNKVETLIARDVAPLMATEDMFVNVTKVAGGKAIGVPGELKGYWELHKKYGRLQWARLFDGVIKLCRNGHIVSPYLAKILNTRKSVILDSETLSAIYINPSTGDVYQEGDYIKRTKLAETFEILQKDGADSMYNNGTIAKRIVEDIAKVDGLVTIEDLMNYKVRWENTVSTKLSNNKSLHTLGLPGSGAMVAFILNVLNDYLPEGESVTSMHRITEAFKYAYAKRTFLGDGHFVKDALDMEKNLTNLNVAAEIRKLIDDIKTYNDYKHYGAIVAARDDHGTANINILAPNGDAISATGTINTLFGSKIVSTQTGIILNDGMDDFSVPGVYNSYGLPPSPANFIVPRKMPLSSMCPTILLDENDNVELLIGGAGGSKITSSIAYVLSRYLFFNESLLDAVYAPRIHHQLLPMQIDYEDGMPDSIIEGLGQIGHKLNKSPSDSGFASLTAIGRSGDTLVPVFDPRRKGSTIVF